MVQKVQQPNKALDTSDPGPRNPMKRPDPGPKCPDISDPLFEVLSVLHVKCQGSVIKSNDE